MRDRSPFLRRSRAVLVSLLAAVWTVEPLLAQYPPIPYDAVKVRKAAHDIQLELPKPRHEEESLAGPLQFIVESVRSLDDLSVVPDDVLDAVVALAGSGQMATGLLARFGDRAVRKLLVAARTGRNLYPGLDAVEALTRMWKGGVEKAPELSPASRDQILALARELMLDRHLTASQLTDAARLAIATGDTTLRAQASRLTDPAELTSRGVSPEVQPTVIRFVRMALDGG